MSFIIEKGQNDYRSSRGFGIISQSKGEHIRSIRFLGDKSSVFFNFIEDYKNPFSSKWNTHNNPQLKSQDSWHYFKIKGVNNSDGTSENLTVIQHTGGVYTEREFEYGSWISLADAIFANGLIKFNLKFLNERSVAVLFR